MSRHVQHIVERRELLRSAGTGHAMAVRVARTHKRKNKKAWDELRFWSMVLVTAALIGILSGVNAPGM